MSNAPSPHLDGHRDDSRVGLAAAILDRFAERTGIVGARAPRRYLWTDAFAVCTWLGLARATGNERHRDRALALIDQVHRTLGRHRPDDGRSGWLSGLPDREAERHPTARGLRIGKPLPERAPGQPADARLEWDRDGQYFHYLTRWMHALDVAARTTRSPRLCAWARELAMATCRAFVHRSGPTAAPQMYWKMSIDLSRPLVASMGQHDPLDGLVTLVQIQATARVLGDREGAEALADDIAVFGSMLDPSALVTDDPLGIGGLLLDAVRLDQLAAMGAMPASEPVIRALVGAAASGLEACVARGELLIAAHTRLPFRELGLAIGLSAARPLTEADRGRPEIPRLRRFLPLGPAIESFWLEPAHQQVATFTDHLDINEVMLATSLAPDGYASIPADVTGSAVADWCCPSRDHRGVRTSWSRAHARQFSHACVRRAAC